MPFRVGHCGDIHLEEDRYFGDTAQCLESFVYEGIRENVNLFVIDGDLTTYKATIKERNLWIDMVIRMAEHAPVLLVAGNHGRESDGDLYALAKARGQHLFPSDHVHPGMLWLQVVRSPTPHARILSIDVGAARTVPGVHAVLTAQDIGPRRYGKVLYDCPVLAYDRVRFVGDHPAVVNDRNAVAQLLGFLEIMGGQHDRDALPIQSPDIVPQLLAKLDVDAGGRLVEHEDRRRMDHRLGDQEALEGGSGDQLAYDRLARARVGKGA